MASVVDICNGALNQLGATTILSLTEDSKNARLCNQRFTQVRDAVFRSHPWNCLQKRQELAADTTAPAWGFKFAYTLPADCLRLLRILDYDSNYKVEGRKILTNAIRRLSSIFPDFLTAFVNVSSFKRYFSSCSYRTSKVSNCRSISVIIYSSNRC